VNEDTKIGRFTNAIEFILKKVIYSVEENEWTCPISQDASSNFRS